jgi:hypothetical protein
MTSLFLKLEPTYLSQRSNWLSRLDIVYQSPAARHIPQIICGAHTVSYAKDNDTVVRA